ncbi:MAG: hypothetical protein OXU77_16550 [Gammaproteobacteria bacterium]|nr:hypothetical protein [Gammaproteobacteria bacterium]
MPSTRISAGEISAHVDTDGVNGWCGLRHMEHSASSAEWLLSPALTLEHYIGVPPDEPGFIQYEPCYSLRSLHDASADRCRLRYHPTACSQTTCDIRYVIDPPHSVDVMIDAVTSRHSWPLGSLALFFATIVNAPVYEGVTFRGYEGSRHPGAGPWIHFNGHAETLGRVVHPSGVSNPELRRPQPPPPTYSDSSVRFDEPFYFGTVGRMAYAVFFAAAQHRYVRFVVNPLAPAFGGPAWDFLWLIRSPEPGKRYSLTMRVVLRPFTGVEDMLAEYHDYVGRA